MDVNSTILFMVYGFSLMKGKIQTEKMSEGIRKGSIKFFTAIIKWQDENCMKDIVNAERFKLTRQKSKNTDSLPWTGRMERKK